MTVCDCPAVAVIADAHVHDIAADYGGSTILLNGQARSLRSWADTRSAARAFNESAQALTAALNEITARGIRHVVLLGDYSDDGQRLATQHLAACLHDWQAREGLSFYAIPGNHDVFGPLGKHNSTRFVTAPGQTRLVTSDPGLAASEPQSARLSAEMYCAGQPEGLMPMAAFGLFRQKHYLHWESPFGTDDRVAARLYTAQSSDGRTRHQLMDASYLVEPVPGLWLLMLDANVFEPRSGREDPARKKAFLDPSCAGWNALLRVKPFLLAWIADVTGRAERQGKRLLTFSHYPVLDPFEDDIGAETTLFGATDVARRTPKPEVAEALMAAGVSLHFSGHMHVNAKTQGHGHGRVDSLSNIAVPSLVSFPPAFVVVRSQGAGQCIDTVDLFSEPLDPVLMDFYRKDAAAGPPLHDLAADEGLRARRYGSFLHAQLRTRAQRQVVKYWPSNIVAGIAGASAADLACCLLAPGAPSPSLAGCADQADTAARCAALATDAGLSLATLQQLPLTEVIADWYCLRQAGPLARDYVSAERMQLLRFLTKVADQADPACAAPLPQFFRLFLQVLTTSLRRMTRSCD
jgi:3',5'-cyclic AMP phosphodiesterase CpdA